MTTFTIFCDIIKIQKYISI